MASDRNEQIENIRAIAIIIVMLGHSIILYTGWGVMDTSRTVPYISILKLFINVIEMPLFMSISGYVFFYSIRKGVQYGGFILGKIKRTLIPYLFVGTLWMIPLHRLGGAYNPSENYMHQVFDFIFRMEGLGQLWFLISLFMIFAFFFPVIKVSEKTGGMGEISLLAVLLLISYAVKSNQLLTSIDNVAIMRFFYYMFWFYLGYLINENSRRLFCCERKYRTFIGICCVIAFTVCFMLYNDNHSETFYYSAALFGVLSMYTLIPKKSNRIMKFISRNSFGMYLFHSPMVYITFKYWGELNPYFVIMFNVFCLGSIATLMTVGLRHSPFALIIGEKSTLFKNSRS